MGRSFEVEQRSARSRSNIRSKRHVEDFSPTKYEVHESARPFRDPKQPTAEYEALTGCYNGHEDYESPRQYYCRREDINNAPKIQGCGYSHEPEPASQNQYQKRPTSKPICESDEPTAEFERRTDRYSGQQNYGSSRQYGRSREHMEIATDVRDYAYPEEQRLEPHPEHQSRSISEDVRTRWQTYQRRLPARNREEPVEEYQTRIDENSDQQKYESSRRYERSREDISRTPDDNFSQEQKSHPHLENLPESISSERTIWQGHYSQSSSQSTEHLQLESSVWARRETLDGLYCYYLNTKDGRMTDPQPIPREKTDDEEFEISRLRITPQSPPVFRKAAPSITQGANISPALPVEVPYRCEPVQNMRVEKKEPVQILGSTSTNTSKPSHSSAENLPQSPRSYYRNPVSIEHDLRRDVFKPLMKSLPRPPIGVYNNREYAYQYTSKKGGSPNRMPPLRQSSKTPVPPAVNSASTSISKISEAFPPSPRSHYGYAGNPAIPRPPNQARASATPHNRAQATLHRQTPITPHPQPPPRSHHSLPHNNQPPALLANNLSSFEEAYGEQKQKGDYKVPFVNTVTDIDEGERQSWASTKLSSNQTIPAANQPRASTKPNQPPHDITSVPLRPRASTPGSGQSIESATKRRAEGDEEREYRNGGKVRWTGSS